MTTPVYSNNISTTISADILSTDTEILVPNAAIYDVAVKDVTGEDYRRHQIATLDDGAAVEIIHILNANTATNYLTVSREEENTTAVGFLAGTSLDCRLTAELLNRAPYFYVGHDWWYERWEGEYSIGLIAFADDPENTATGTSAIAIGRSPMAASTGSIAIGYDTEVSAAANFGISIGYVAKTAASNGISVGAYSDALAVASLAVGNGAQAPANGTSLGAYSAGLNDYAIALGYGSDADAGAGDACIAIGHYSFARTGALGGVTIGTDSEVYEINGVALGNDMINRLANSHVIAGLSLAIKDTGQTNFPHYFSAQENIIFSDVVDLTTTGELVNIALPSLGTFFPDEVGLIITSASSATVAATISFGNATVTDEILTATLTTALVAKERDRYGNISSLASEDGQVALTMNVTVAATATALLGRVYFKGLFVEDE